MIILGCPTQHLNFFSFKMAPVVLSKLTIKREKLWNLKKNVFLF